ncbi:hypothetical protein [Noviherbaspirillum galbum]|uniref:Uncharacterized protein n=1 Tax=Noviherbaspirillum galbum TaxID=2709383 RepID=A0A6B3SXA6_9BURK|nr:hypothetical protein [Noviherbaspirillum galbum]NEX64165.1 hypothetical protein [Noviherbaspirillum galbum]
MTQRIWKKGDRVTWRCEDAPLKVSPIPARVVQEDEGAEIAIDILLRIGSQWVRERRRVPASSLMERRRVIPQLDEELIEMRFD